MFELTSFHASHFVLMQVCTPNPLPTFATVAERPGYVSENVGAIVSSHLKPWEVQGLGLRYYFHVLVKYPGQVTQPGFWEYIAKEYAAQQEAEKEHHLGYDLAEILG